MSNNKRKPRILLIDEVDVFFDKDFYGETYNIEASLINEFVVELFKFIWKERFNPDLNIEFVIKSAEFKNWMEKNQEF